MPFFPDLAEARRIYNRGRGYPRPAPKKTLTDHPMDEKEKPFHNPFEALRGLAVPAPVTGDAAPPPAPALPDGSKLIPRAIVRLERSGRRGKEVTVVEHLAIATAARDEWLKALKAALGCGGSVEGERLVLQGDQRKRLPALLQGRGVKKIIVV